MNLTPSPHRNSFCRGNSRLERTLLCQLSYSSLSHWRDSNPQPLYEVTRAFATLQTFCGGNHRPRYLSAALSIELRQLAPLAGVEPATVGSRCNLCLHHAANSRILAPYFIAPSRTHTRSMHSPTSHRFVDSLSRKVPGGIGAHGETAFSPGERCVLPRPKK